MRCDAEYVHCLVCGQQMKSASYSREMRGHLSRGCGSGNAADTCNIDGCSVLPYPDVVEPEHITAQRLQISVYRRLMCMSLYAQVPWDNANHATGDATDGTSVAVRNSVTYVHKHTDQPGWLDATSIRTHAAARDPLMAQFHAGFIRLCIPQQSSFKAECCTSATHAFLHCTADAVRDSMFSYI